MSTFEQPETTPEPLSPRTLTEVGERPHARPPGTALAAGELLAGRYRIVRFVAGGGMGEVYEAEDALLREPVAVKLLRAELVKKPGAQERFADEIRLARRVTHPNVCRVFDVGIDGERVFFTMELHHGITLAEHLAATGPLDPPDATPLVRQLLLALGAAHAADVVHADLKPSNVLLTGKGHERVVITDFGLAVPCCSELGCGCDMPHLLGTPAYMAPEQVAGGLAGESTDMFALGVILFEMTTGLRPYRGPDAFTVARARLSGAAPSPRVLRPDLPESWDRVIRACLAREPAARPQSTADVAGALGIA
ncbi:MAG: serine/threonine protein kinase [Polyangiaceae bacterium]|nr:serine/threonine protein kinase [Polyangiaceae bacterium]